MGPGTEDFGPRDGVRMERGLQTSCPPDHRGFAGDWLPMGHRFSLSMETIALVPGNGGSLQLSSHIQ